MNNLEKNDDLSVYPKLAGLRFRQAASLWNCLESFRNYLNLLRYCLKSLRNFIDSLRSSFRAVEESDADRAVLKVRFGEFN